MKRRWICINVIILLIILGSTQAVFAAGVVGNGTAGSCTESALRTALNNGGTVTFNCGGSPKTITLASRLVITKTTTIDGGGLITLSGGGTVNVIYNDSPLLTLRNLTIADGYLLLPASITGGPIVDGGGGVRGEYKASLTVENCTFINNKVVSQATNIVLALDNGGGAIFNHTGTLTIRNSTFQSNRSENSSGGAIHSLHSDVDISDTVFDSNTSTLSGGGFYNDGVMPYTAGAVRFTRVTFINNQAIGQGGGAFNFLHVNHEPNSKVIYFDVKFIGNKTTVDPRGYSYGGALRLGNGPMYVTNTTFEGNSVEKHGGAIWTGESATVYLTNVTISNNQATSADSLGGGIRMGDTGKVYLTNVTIANNSAGYRGGALSGGGTNVKLVNTIIGENTAGNPYGEYTQCGQTYLNGGGNIQAIHNYGSGTNNPECVPGIAVYDPKLSSLMDVPGAFGRMYTLLAGSPAIDGGINAGCPDTDQRGALRPLEGNGDGTILCDSGSYEADAVAALTAPSVAPYKNRFTSTTIDLTWTFITWASGYDIEVDNQSNFSSVNARKSVDGGQTLATSIQVPSAGVVYFWHIRAKKSDGTIGVWSAPETFYVEPSS
ncbi:MAG: choice-of-anchor Q domain-containing protein [Chloroflexota bacterium]